MRFSGRGVTSERKANVSFWHWAMTSRTIKEIALWNHDKNGARFFLGISTCSRAMWWKEFTEL